MQDDAQADQPDAVGDETLAIAEWKEKGGKGSRVMTELAMQEPQKELCRKYAAEFISSPADFKVGVSTNLREGLLPPEGGNWSTTERWWNLPTTTLYPGGTTQTQSWDAFGRISGQQTKTPGQVTIQQRTYTYDLENNPLKIESEQGQHQYQYDPLYRLTQALHPAGLPTERFTLDGVGNRLTDESKPNPAEADNRWKYNANHQLEQAATENTALFGSNAQPVTHSWDDAGNLIRKHTPLGTEALHPHQNQRYQYDAQNRLTETQDADGNAIASYQYDPYGRRIRKTIYREWNSGWQPLAESKTRYYLYSDEGLVAEYEQLGNGTPELIAQYGWEPVKMWGTRPLWMQAMRSDTNTTERYHYLNDHLGTPQQLIDAQGKVVWSQMQTAFGETKVDNTSVVTNPLRFPGQYYDEETQTHYNYFRDYDPSTGRYVQSDPIGLDGGMNIYTYGNGNSISYIDPKGGFAIPVVVYYAAAAIIGAMIANSAAQSKGGNKGKSDDPFDGATGSGGGSSSSTSQETTKQEDANKRAGDAPGNCTPEEHKELQDQVNSFCKQNGTQACSSKDSCPTLEAKLAVNTKCATARTKIMNKCFAGGDRNHQRAAESYWRAVQNCTVALALKQCGAAGEC